MNTKSKMANMSVMRKILMMAAFSMAGWNRSDLYLGQSGYNEKGNPAYSPRRKKFKGWQRQAREAK